MPEVFAPANAASEMNRYEPVGSKFPAASTIVKFWNTSFVSERRVRTVEPVYAADTFEKSTIDVPMNSYRANAGNVIVLVMKPPTMYAEPDVITEPGIPARPTRLRELNSCGPFGLVSKIRRTRVHVVPEPVQDPCHVPDEAESEGAESNRWFAVIVIV